MKRHSAAEKALEVIDAEIADILGDAATTIHPFFTITRKAQWNGGFEVPRQKVRVLRVRRKNVKEEQEQAA